MVPTPHLTRTQLRTLNNFLPTPRRLTQEVEHRLHCPITRTLPLRPVSQRSEERDGRESVF
jgi:hypothetical protein